MVGRVSASRRPPDPCEGGGVRRKPHRGLAWRPQTASGAWAVRHNGRVLFTGNTCPGMRQSQLLYGLDQANGLGFAVLVEGPTDAWRYGPGAVAAFGKSVSPAQLELLRASFDDVVVLLGGDAREESRAAADRLAALVRRAVLVRLREGVDPGSLPRARLRSIVQGAVA